MLRTYLNKFIFKNPKSAYGGTFLPFIFLFFLLLTFNLFTPRPSLAQSDWTGRCVSAANPDVATIQGAECLFANVLSVITLVAGLVFFFMLIAGGFQYYMAAGDPKRTAGVQAQLTSSVIGLVGIIASFFILRFIENFTGVSVTDFIIPGP
jgi:hypothetical protein